MSYANPTFSLPGVIAILSFSWLLGGCGGEASAPKSASLAESGQVTPGESASALGEASAVEGADAMARGLEVEAPPKASSRIVFLGDSLTAGLSLNEEQAFPYLVGKRLQEAGFAVEVINAGVSGDTSAGGLRRLSWLLQQDPALVVVELGANDGLRGLSLEATEDNLRQIFEQVRSHGAKVLLLGMMIPPNYGPEYSSAFAALFPKLAEELNLPLMPFLLEGVAAQPDLNLPDGIHPNAAGHEILAEKLFPYLEPLVREMAPELTSEAAGIPLSTP
ncbi:MAG: arylesterase [Deltaproteobacteria bacterium]|nr:arylesterase [Deltaproteobacteria bacterium]